ncbi:hypothetical protein MUB24_08010 [Lederbergia sp. NSJ-179]|uniref:glycosyl hydrolase n=1 Tax=Lederbergia sp. NSJ-179 TaxID=2931402 RepID=UPI001FD4521B|nr:glycosyl hydrolase [Lederbergia sp. NSJ-179]MCJ7840848.1 hypothetical protein [Lederbergia sp. NSJ-179]
MNSSIQEQFLHPAEEFTPVPFWFWNDRLSKEDICRQIHDFHEKGVTGFVLHPRIGIPREIEYLSDEFMEFVEIAVQEADQLGMSVILYDEAMYPSGSANGKVVKENPDYASRGLKMVEYPCKGGTNEFVLHVEKGETVVSVQAVKKLSESSISYHCTQLLEVKNNKVQFTTPDHGEWSVLLFVETFSQGTIRGIHFGEDDGEPHAPPSTDLLNREAVNKFIQLTHDTYFAKLKRYFGNTIIAMFTDEPDILGRGSLGGLKPWTNQFLDFYKRNGNEETDLPVLWLDAGEKTALIRKKYRKTVHLKMTESYYQPISKWCADHQIALTGHPAASDDIGLLDHFQIPGQDVVWRWVGPEGGKAIEGHHSTAGKCSADAARHRGRRRNLNEFLGVCGKESAWALSPGDMKWYMDWLFVRGVNLLCPHAFYYSIDGKRRSHERPPDVGPNNLWWPYYKQFAQYMKRLSWLMTDSTNETTIAVLCEEDFLPWKIVKPLYENQIEFNYLEESLFQSDCTVDGGVIRIANQKYEVVVIEDHRHFDSKIIPKLAKFVADGGKVIIWDEGDSPLPNLEATFITTAEEIVEAIPALNRNEFHLIPSDPSIRLSKVRKDQLIFYFIVNEGEDNYQGQFCLKEEGKVEIWDPWNATIEGCSVYEDGMVSLILPRRSSLVFCVDPSQEPIMVKEELSEPEMKKITLSEGWKSKDGPVPSLESWDTWEGMKFFSGTITYENNFELDEIESIKQINIDLGEVYEIAKLFINQKEIGVKMWAPYQFALDPAVLKKGRNRIKVEVTNSIANQMDQVPLKSGLLGPVEVEIGIDQQNKNKNGKISLSSDHSIQ